MALTACTGETSDLRLPLSSMDRDHCRYLRLEWRTFGVLVKRTREPDHSTGALIGVEPSTALAHLDGLIELARKLHGTDPDFYPHRLARLLCERAEILEKDGQRHEAIAAYKQAILVEDCAELKAILHEMVQTIKDGDR